MDVYELLHHVKSGAISIEDAAGQLKHLPYENLGFAKIDHHRKLRQGFEEVIYCSGKSLPHLVRIYTHMAEEGIEILGTRASQEQYEAVSAALPEVTYDPISRILKRQTTEKSLIGNIAICTGGTADIPVAEEAAQTAEFFGSKVTRVYDVGVAGIHRLLSNLSLLEHTSCVIAAAGMEGALPGVIAGLVDVPVIAVPTSIGYGANFGGHSSLLTMINSCSNGISVVNIDNGYGAGYLGTQINRLAVNGIG